VLGNRHPYRDRLLASVTGLVNQDLLVQNEYLAAENRVLRAHLPARLCLSAPERSMFVRAAQEWRHFSRFWPEPLEPKIIGSLAGTR